MTKSLLIVLFVIISAQSGFGSNGPLVQFSKSTEQTRRDYLKYLDRFNEKHCSGKDKREFKRLFKKAREITAYVPELGDGAIDVDTIKNGLKKLDEKWNWLIGVRTALRKQKKWPNRWTVFKPMEKSIDELLKLKEKRFLKGDKSSALRKQSKRLHEELHKQFTSLLEQLYFVKGFDYPADHLQQRMIYEDNKERRSKSEVKAANGAMFLRRLQEDGTFDADHRGPDMYLRTTLNTIAVNLKSGGPWLDEDVRYDLEWAIIEMRKQLRWGKERQLRRIQEWINRTAEVREFYTKLLSPESGQAERRQFVQTQEAGRQLADFVYTKNAAVYHDLLKESEERQALYVFDQILLHEAGNATSDNFRDRKDIAQVVINSRLHPEMSVIRSSERLHGYLRRQGVPEKTLKESSWLNVMFKYLRFSFTLHYIPAVEHVFCPDFYKTAVETRGKNLYLIMDALASPRNDFKALRYFSRQSMVGRIDMTKIWKGFRRLPERVGNRYENDKALKSAVVKGRYRYLYSFNDDLGIEHHVLEIKNKKYAMRGSLEKPDFYAYRDRHQFWFFVAD